MKLVTIPEERFLELIDAERSAESCKSCGQLAQRDRIIDAKDAEIVRLKERISCLDELIANGKVDTAQVEMNRIVKKYELIANGKVETAQVEFNRVYKRYEVAAACIGRIENILRSGTDDAANSALARVIQYHDDLDRIERGMEL